MKRAQLPDEVFGIPQERKYPMPDERHTISAIKLFNHVEDKYEEQLAKAIIKNMKKYNINSSMIGDNNRLKKYLPKDMIFESSTNNFEFLDISTNKQKALSYFKSIGKNYDKYIDLYYGEIIIDKGSDKVIGSVLVGNKKDKGFITDLWIDKKYQGQGLGGKLVKDAINKYGGIDLTVKKDNGAAIHLYKKHGFVPIEYDNDKYYWMKLKNKLSKDDKILHEMEFHKEHMRENIILNKKDISENYLLEDTGEIKNVIFDLGNVLVSTNMEDKIALDPEIPNDKIHYIMSQWYRDEDDTIGLDEFKKIIPDRLKELSQFIPRLFDYNVQCVNDFSYTIPLIDNLIDSGYNVYFLSNWSKWSYELLDKYHKFDFLGKMNGGLWSWQAECLKPDEKIYKLLLDKYNLNPEECIFFDDLEENVEAAKRLGIKGVVFDRLGFDIDNFFDKNIYGIVEESGILDDKGKRNINKNTDPYNSKKVSKSITSTAFKLSLKHLFDKKSSDQYEWVRNEYIPKIVDKCKTDADIKYMRDDSYIAQQQMLTLLRNIEAVENNDTVKMKRLSKSFIKKVQSGEINSKDVRRHYNWLRGEGRQLLNKKAKEIRNSIKESVTAGTVVGSNQADSVYIVNYMQNNAFSGHKEPRLGICKKGMKDLHTFGGRYNRFHYVSDLNEFKEEASDIKIYRYTGTPKNSFYEIIEDTVTDLDLYKLLTGRDLPDRSFIEYDSEFIQEECFLDTLDAIRECTEAGLLSLAENKYPVPILTETVQGRPYNYYRDLDGVFIQHEVTKIRSKSYNNKDDIPEAQVNAVKRGYLY